MSELDEENDTDRGQQIDLTNMKELVGIKTKSKINQEGDLTPVNKQMTLQLNTEPGNVLRSPMSPVSPAVG